MTLSIVIPTWTGSLELLRMASDLIEQVQDDCDELIVCEDGGWTDLHDLCDRYFWHPNIGDVRNSTLGMLAATSDYIAVINSDVIIRSGSVRDLCIPGRVVSPKWREQSQYQGFQGCFFVLDRQVLEKYGYFDISKRKSADYEYAERIREVFTWSDAVEYTHLMGRSYSEQRRQLEEKERG